MTKPYSEQMLDELRKLGRSEQWIADFVRFATIPGSSPSPHISTQPDEGNDDETD